VSVQSRGLLVSRHMTSSHAHAHYGGAASDRPESADIILVEQVATVREVRERAAEILAAVGAVKLRRIALFRAIDQHRHLMERIHHHRSQALVRTSLSLPFSGTRLAESARARTGQSTQRRGPRDIVQTSRLARRAASRLAEPGRRDQPRYANLFCHWEYHSRNHGWPWASGTMDRSVSA
jgi:hypothetical protein